MYAVARSLTRTRFFSWLFAIHEWPSSGTRFAGQGAWVQFLLRLSPIVPYVLLNYALGLSRVRFRDFLVACVGMIPAIVMYTCYYGKVVGDVAKLAAGVAPPHGREYYILLVGRPRRHDCARAWRSRARRVAQSSSSG